MEEQIRRAFPAIGQGASVTENRDTEETTNNTEPPSEPSSARVEGMAPTTAADGDDRTDQPGTTSEARGDASSEDTPESKSDDIPGGTEMTSESAQSESTTNDAPAQAQGRNDTDRQSNGKMQQRNGQQQKDGNSGRGQSPTYFYDPQGAARAGLLRLATDWKEAGSTYQAMHAYMEVLTRYPQTGAAAAATEGLVDLADRLQKQGRFYAALNIYDKLDAML
jgi:hypothetical protein